MPATVPILGMDPVVKVVGTLTPGPLAEKNNGFPVASVIPSLSAIVKDVSGLKGEEGVSVAMVQGVLQVTELGTNADDSEFLTMTVWVLIVLAAIGVLNVI